MKFITHSPEETQKVSKDIVHELLLYSTSAVRKRGAVVVGLYGNLGAGKTSLTQGVAKALGVLENIVSPTFVIEKIYALDFASRPLTHLIHIDAYRLEKSSELLRLGWNEIISDPNNLILIEWPENVAEIMPEHVKIRLKPLENPDSREIEVEL